jgi:hypothetical protein
MPIVSSSHRFDGPAQIDGSRWVVESHTDHLGSVFLVGYPASAGADLDAAMNARVPLIDDMLAQDEFEGLLNGA